MDCDSSTARQSKHLDHAGKSCWGWVVADLQACLHSVDWVNERLRHCASSCASKYVPHLQVKSLASS